MHVDVSDLSPQELALLQHSLGAIRKTRSHGLHYFFNFLGLTWHEVKDGRCLATMPTGLHVRNTHGFVQGGVIAALADLSMGPAIRSALPPNTRLVTVELKVNYLRPGQGQELRAVGECLRAGSHLSVAESRITDDQGDLVAVATGTFARYDPPAAGADGRKVAR